MKRGGGIPAFSGYALEEDRAIPGLWPDPKRAALADPCAGQQLQSSFGRSRPVYPARAKLLIARALAGCAGKPIRRAVTTGLSAPVQGIRAAQLRGYEAKWVSMTGYLLSPGRKGAPVVWLPQPGSETPG